MFGERRGPSFTRSEGGECDGVTDTPPRPSDEGSAPERMPPWLPRAVALVFAAVVLFFLGWWVLRELRSLLIMIFVALFLSLAMEPAVTRLARRGWRRGPATGLVLGGVIVVVIVFMAAAGSVVVGQVSDLADDAPRYVRDFERFVNEDLGIDWDADNVVREIRSGEALGDPDVIVSNALDLGVAIAAALLEIVTVLIFAFYMTADGPRMRRVICSRLPTPVPAGGAGHVGDRDRQDRRLSLFARHPGGDLRVLHVGVPVRARCAVLARARRCGSASCRSSSR